LDDGDSALLRFAADLRTLRDKAGGHSYRQLGARAHYSATTLSDAAGGRKLPSLAVTLAYVQACEGDLHEWEERWHEVASDVAPQAQRPVDNTNPPYAGLAAFQPEDADWFFGRDRILDDLIRRTSTRRFVGVFGASGVGKSSLLRAGLVPRIREGELDDEYCRSSIVITPAELDTSPAVLNRVIGEASSKDALVLVVDQFEEIFTLCPSAAERTAFIESLLAASQTRCRVVIGVRADFYGHCAQHPALVEALQDGQLLVGPMGPEELRQAIMGPATKAGCTVQTALVSRLVADATGQPGVLPLLSHALLETWRRRRGTTLTLAGYEAAGGIQHAIAQTAERTYTALETEQRTLARQIFLRLTALGDGTEDTKRRLATTELDDDVNTQVVLDRLAHARLLTLDRDGVEIAHEALIRSWPRLRDWLNHDRDGLRTQRQLTEAASTWDSLNRDSDALYRGARLDTAADWATHDGVRLSTRERDFLDASLVARDREQVLSYRRTRRLRQLVALLLVLLLLASGAIVQTIRVQNMVAEQLDTAVAERVVVSAKAIRGTDQNLAKQLSVAAFNLADTKETRDNLLSTSAATQSEYRIKRVQPPLSSNGLSPDGRSSGAEKDGTQATAVPLRSVASLVVLANKRVLAFRLEGAVSQLLNLTDPQKPEVAHVFPIELTAGAIAPDGKSMTIVDRKNIVHVLDISEPDAPREVKSMSHVATITQVRYDPNGQTLVTIDSESTVRLWDLGGPGSPMQWGELPSTPFISTVALSLDRRMMATGGADDVVRLWDLGDPWHPRLVGELTGHSNDVFAVAFTKDAKRIVTVANDQSVRLWDISNPGSPTESATINGQTDEVHTVEFVEGESKVMTSSTNGESRLWDFDIPRAIKQLCGGVKITPEQWEQYFPRMTYQDPCP
jgi:hypothetical protein